jgi:hypothetical protein
MWRGLIIAVLLSAAARAELRVGAAAESMKGDDAMVIAGGILPRFVKG